MNVVDQSREGARVDLSKDELELINNVLNELANGINMSDDELATRLGFGRDEVKALLAGINGLLNRMTA